GNVEGNIEDGFTITNVEMTEVSGEKQWTEGFEGDEYRPDQVTINLFANGSPSPIDSKNVSSADNWKFTFDNLKKYDSSGNKIIYTIGEESVIGYTASVDNDTYEVTNTQKTIEVSSEKQWVDG